MIQADTLVSVSKLDQEILNAVVRQGYDRESVVEWLKKRVQNEATVMYHLLLDQQRQIPQAGYLGGELGEASAAQLTGRFLQRQGSQTSHQRRVLAQRQWNLGTHVQGLPKLIMEKLYSVLRAKSVAWKKLAAFCLKCRKALPASESTSSGEGVYMTEDDDSHPEESKNKEQIIKFEIQLYRVRNEEYIVDCQVSFCCLILIKGML